ncbi:MAG: hypothetical protein QM725_16710 [Lacibacter sp.]
MKKFILAALILFSISSCSKIDDLIPSADDSASVSGTNIAASSVPTAVMNAWKAKYPGAGGEIEWQKEDGNTYKVKFWLGTERWQAIFSATGGFLSEKRLK